MTSERLEYAWTLQLSQTNHGRLQTIQFLEGSGLRSGLPNRILDHYLFEYPEEFVPVELKPIDEARKGLFMRVGGETAREVSRRATARQVGPYTIALYTMEYGLQDLAARNPRIDEALAIRERDQAEQFF